MISYYYLPLFIVNEKFFIYSKNDTSRKIFPRYFQIGEKMQGVFFGYIFTCNYMYFLVIFNFSPFSYNP